MIQKLKNKKILVTGAGGFLGSHLVERLISEGLDIRAFIRYTSLGNVGFLRLLSKKQLKNIEIFYGDLREMQTVQKAVKDVKIIIHLGALIGIPYSYINSQEVVDTNVLGTFNILNAALESKQIERVIITSTSEVYGTARYVPIDEKHPLQPQSPYSATKISADALANSFYNSFGLPVAIIRPFNTYGPRQSDRAIIPTIISQALTGNTVKIGASNPIRDFTYVSDTVEAFLKMAISDSAIGEVVNIGSGQGISIQHLVKFIGEILGKNIRIRKDAKRLRPDKSEVLELVCDNSKAKKLLGWKPTINMHDGLKNTIVWVSQNTEIYNPENYRV